MKKILVFYLALLQANATKVFQCGLIVVSLVAGMCAASSAALAQTNIPLEASDTVFNDYFGISVAISGDLAIVGADGHDALGASSGAAYIFHWNGSSWDQAQKLLASDGMPADAFGRSVAIDGNRAVVVAPGKLINNNPTGATYVFKYNGTSWVEEQRLSVGFSGNAAASTASASIFGDVIVIGNSSAGYSGYQAGTAFVFWWNGLAWVQLPKLLASDANSGDYFGWSVAAFGDWVVVGAWGDDDRGSTSGAAYVFKRNDNGTPQNLGDDFWEQKQKLVPPDGAAYDQFGYSVGINAETVVVGAYGGLHLGAAYVYALNGTTWIQVAKFSAGYPMSFGSAVAVSSNADKISVGAPQAAKSFVFSKAGSNWVEESRSSDPDAANASYNRYGSSVASSAQFALVGAYGANGAAYSSTLGTTAPSIASSSPPHGYIDPLEDRDASSGTLLGLQNISLTFSEPVTSAGASALGPANFQVRCVRNGAAALDLQTGLVPSVTQVSGSGAGPYTLQLSQRLCLGAWTEIKAVNVVSAANGTPLSASGYDNRVVLGNLPMDITQDGRVLGDDISRWLAIKNNAFDPAPLTKLQLLDQDRDGSVLGPDINRAIQLLNGTATFGAWTNFDMGAMP